MSATYVLSEDAMAQIPPHACWAQWRPGLPCPNRAVWRIENTTNPGYSRVCDPHKEAFADTWPEAAVRFVALAEDDP